MKKMRIRIDREGKTTIAVEGAAGDACVEFTRLVEQAAGEVEKRVLTEDYYKEEVEDRLNLIEEDRL